MIQIKLGSDYHEVNSEFKEKLIDVAGWQDAEFLADILSEFSAASLGKAIELLEDEKYPQARARQQYAKAIEDVATLLRGGLKESLSDKTP